MSNPFDPQTDPLRIAVTKWAHDNGNEMPDELIEAGVKLIELDDGRDVYEKVRSIVRSVESVYERMNEPLYDVIPDDYWGITS